MGRVRRPAERIRLARAPGGVNLYASTLFRPSLPARAAPVFSFIASLALCDAMWAEAVPAGIKWPNDVVVDGRRKVAGTLVACATAGDMVEYVILGVGVDLNVDREALTVALGEAAGLAASLGELTGRVVDRNAFAATYLNLLEKWLATYRTRGADAILAAWRDRDVLAGRRVAVRSGDERWEGRAAGVNPDGHLLLDGDGRHRAVVSGEVVVLD